MMLFFTATLKAQSSTAPVIWPEFVSRHNLVWEDLPLQWNEGAFTGNGMLGMMVYVSEKDGGIVFSLGRTDVTDHRKMPDKKTSIGAKDATVVYDFCRLPVGKMVLRPAGKILSGKITQDIWNAEIKGSFETTTGQLSISAFVPRNTDVQVIEVKEPGKTFANKTYSWKFIPGNAHSPRALVKPGDKGSKEYKPNPLPVVSRDKNYYICRQDLLAGGDYATVWAETPSATGGSVMYISTVNEVPKSGASVPLAVSTVQAAVQKGADKLAADNKNWWHGFYQKSFLSIPDARVESFYWIQLYKMACASRPGGPAVDLFGPFYKTSAWPGMWWNLNIQLTYFPVYESNHLELGENMIDIVDENFETLLEKFSGSKLGDLCWTLHNYWKQFAYAGEIKSIATKWLPKALKVLDAYKKMMKGTADGKIELLPMKSPEYHGSEDFPNSNYNLANLRWLLNAIILTSEKLDINKEKIAGWKNTLASIVPYPTNENGLMIAGNQPVDESHRHYSHLLALYPLFQLNPDLPQDSALVSKSVYHWHTIQNGKALAGYSYTGAASLFAALGKGDEALKNIKQLIDGATGISQFHTNTFYTESGGKNMVIETPLSGAASIMELLMQSRNNKIAVFPALPSDWKNVSFARLLAEGGYEVSAAYQQGKANWIAIKSKTGAPFTLKCEGLSGLKDITATDKKFKIKFVGANELVIHLPAGATITLKQNNSTTTQMEAVSYTSGKINSFGIKKGQQLKNNQDYQVNDFITW